jgi:hypothetical protein
MKTTTLQLENSMDRGPFRFALLLIPLALVCFGLSPTARADCEQGCPTGQNTVLGDNALVNNTGSENTAVGSNTLSSNTVGFSNTAIGNRALGDNIMGNFNTAVGTVALDFNTTGSNNTAIGDAALSSNTTGQHNTATGRFALLENRVGNYNTATGFGALFDSVGSDNTAIGAVALFHSKGSDNTAVGARALERKRDGSDNIALGFYAGYNLVRGDRNIDIGNQGVEQESATIRMGTEGIHTATYIAGISGATVPTGVSVIVDADGHLGTTTSSARFKEAIKPMDKASEAILALQPVSFRYKQKLDPADTPQFGLVAEEVEKVSPDLVARDDQGKPYTVRYEAVNVMLLNEFLKEHKTFLKEQRKVEEQGAMIVRQQKQIEALTAGLQKVSAQLEVSNPSPQTVLNNQ